MGTNANDAVVLCQLGGGAFTNIQFGSINMALFHTSRSTAIPVTGVSGIITSATKINYGTPSLSTTIQGNLVTANYPAFSNIPRIQC